MARRRNTRDYYPTYSGREKEKTRPRWLIVLFILLIIVTIIGSYLFYHYSTIEEAYQTNLYTSELVPRNGNQMQVAEGEPFTSLLLTLDNVYIEGTQVEEALWATMFYVNPEESKVQSVNIPLNLIVGSSDGEVSLNTYPEGGLPSVKDNLEELLEIPINYVSLVRLQNIRDVVDPLNQIDVYIPEALEPLDINTNQLLQVNGRELMNLLEEASSLPVLDQAELHQSLYESITTDILQFEKILQLPNNLANGEYTFQTEIPFRKLVEIYRKDDYNLTNVDLDELVTLEYTQMDNRYVYFASLEVIKDVVSRMSMAIDELAIKE